MRTSILRRRRQTGGGGFSPASLFANGEDGVWFEPAIGALQTSSGVIDESGTADPVGFQLSRAQGAGFADGAFTGLGGEMLVNGDFATGDLTGWPSSLNSPVTSFPDGKLLMERAGTNFASLQQVVSGLTVGATYFASFDVQVKSGSSVGTICRLAVRDSGGNITFAEHTSTSEETYGVFFQAAETSCTIRLQVEASLSGDGGFFDNVTLSNVPGIHAAQTASDERPTKRASPVHLEDDGVNDSLSWDAPADDYTIARVNSSGTVTIQTSQALSGATDIMAETTIAGYVAVNRALTAGETATLTAHLEALVA